MPGHVDHEQRRVDCHVENGRNQREPRLLETPEIPHRATHPCVIAALFGQRTGKLADHERGGQTPQNGRQQQDQYGLAIARPMHDFLRAIGAARHHKEGGGDQGPQGEPAEFFVPGYDRELLGRVGWAR